MNKKLTIKDYITFLDENAPEWESDEWIIGGFLQTYYRAGGAYGNAPANMTQSGLMLVLKNTNEKLIQKCNGNKFLSIQPG